MPPAVPPIASVVESGSTMVSVIFWPLIASVSTTFGFTTASAGLPTGSAVCLNGARYFSSVTGLPVLVLMGVEATGSMRGPPCTVSGSPCASKASPCGMVASLVTVSGAAGAVVAGTSSHMPVSKCSAPPVAASAICCV